MANNSNETLVKDLKEQLGELATEISVNYDFPMIIVHRDNVLKLCKILKDDLHFNFLIDIVGTDKFTSEERFEVIYNIVNLRTQNRILVKTTCEEEKPVVDTVVGLWPAANWYEREIYDMYGIRFNNHPDLRRIYMPEDFEYFPLRKEFPLIGIPGSIDLPNSTPDID